MLASSQINLPGNSVHVLDNGKPGPALLFVHGNSMSSRIWEKQFSDPHFDDYRIISIDLPGHGKSGHSIAPDQDYSLPGYATILLAVINHLRLTDYVLVGFSLGGNIALEAATQLTGCKGIFITSTVLFNTAGDLGKALRTHPAIAAIFKAEVSAEEVREAVDLFFTDGLPADKEIYQADFFNTDPNCRSWLSKSIAENRLHSNIAHIKKAPMPIAYITGVEDKYLDIDYLLSLDLKLWGGEVILLPNAGHVPQTEYPVEFNAQLEKFLKEVLNIAILKHAVLKGKL
jgi:pimeloyl-ACP methyl ester carboxylesterase